MDPAPVGVNDDLALGGGAAALARALLEGHLGMGLGLLGADALAGDERGGGQQQRGRREEGRDGMHDGGR